MVSLSGVTCLHPGAEEIFYTAKDEGCMVDGVDLGPEPGGRHLSGETL